MIGGGRDGSEGLLGRRLPAQQVAIERVDLVRYAGASDDYVPQHWDHPFMIAHGYPDVIAHGWLTFAHLCRVVTAWAPPEVARIERYAVRYHRPFHPGMLACTGDVVKVDWPRVEVALTASDAQGVVVATGSVTVALRRSIAEDRASNGHEALS